MIILERIEGKIAVLETDQGMIQVPLANMPEGCKEGDVLIQVGNSYQIDGEATQKRKEKLLRRTQKLRNQG